MEFNNNGYICYKTDNNPSLINNFITFGFHFCTFYIMQFLTAMMLEAIILHTSNGFTFLPNQDFPSFHVIMRTSL